MAELGVLEAIRTNRAIRRYKPDPVPPDLIRQVLDAAIRGPSAINRQPWRFLVVTEAQGRHRIAELYHQAWETGRANRAPADSMSGQTAKIMDHASAFAQRGIYDVPAFIFVCSAEPGMHDSILQGVQNLSLAARALGLGTLFTTLLRRVEGEVKEALAIPSDVEMVCMLPLGYPQESFGPVRRRPVEEVTFHERWGP